VPIYLMAIYAKNQQADLSADQKAQLAALAAELKAGATRRRKSRVKR